MSKEDREKQIKIELNDGKKIYIPKHLIKEIVMPGILVQNSYYRLVLNMQNYLESLKKLEQKLVKKKC